VLCEIKRTIATWSQIRTYVKATSPTRAGLAVRPCQSRHHRGYDDFAVKVARAHGSRAGRIEPSAASDIISESWRIAAAAPLSPHHMSRTN
jgi:hypothetical protein